MLANGKPSNYLELIGYLQLKPYIKGVNRHGIGPSDELHATVYRVIEASDNCFRLKTQYDNLSIMAFKDKDAQITYHEDRFTVKYNPDDDHTVLPMTYFYLDELPLDVDPKNFGN